MCKDSAVDKFAPKFFQGAKAIIGALIYQAFGHWLLAFGCIG
jgi:hypothetical protein